MVDDEVILAFGAENLMCVNESVQRAYSFAEIFIQNSPILNLPSAAATKQDVRNLAVDLSLETDCRTGRLKMSSCYQPNKSNNSMHLELLSGDKILTHSSANYCVLPRPAIFRKDYAYTNQLSMFNGDLTGIEPQYGIITHVLSHDKNTPCLVYLVIPDVEYGHACNQVPLSKVFAPRIVGDQTQADYDEFNFALKEKMKTQIF